MLREGSQHSHQTDGSSVNMSVALGQVPDCPLVSDTSILSNSQLSYKANRKAKSGTKHSKQNAMR